MADMNSSADIVVDTREQTSGVVKHWEVYAGNFPGLKTEFRELDAGDFILAGGVVIERKSSTDFMLSVMDKKLAGNIAKLKAEFDRLIYIVEGDIFAPRFHSNPTKLQDALAYMTVIEGVALIPSQGPQSSAEIIFNMASYAKNGAPDSVAMRTAKVADIRSSQQYLVEGLPGLGAERATKLLDAFGSAANVFAASDEAIAEAAGLSHEAVARIRRVLSGEWKRP